MQVMSLIRTHVLHLQSSTDTSDSAGPISEQEERGDLMPGGAGLRCPAIRLGEFLLTASVSSWREDR